MAEQRGKVTININHIQAHFFFQSHLYTVIAAFRQRLSNIYYLYGKKSQLTDLKQPAWK